jgi:hypothetical protein
MACLSFYEMAFTDHLTNPEISLETPHRNPLPEGRNAAPQKRSEAGLSKEDAQRQVRAIAPWSNYCVAVAKARTRVRLD